MTHEMTHDTMADQRTRLLERLRIGPLSADQARQELGISHPAARIWELRHGFGVDIAHVRFGGRGAYLLMTVETA